MKKIISLFLVLTFVLSIIPSTVFAEESKVVFEENFDNCTGLLPDGWTLFENEESEVYIQSVHAISGNALKMVDKSETMDAGITSPFFKVKPSTPYTLEVDIYSTDKNYLSIYIQFYDKDKNLITDKRTSSTYTRWKRMQLIFDSTADTEYATVSLVENYSVTANGYYDNVKMSEGYVWPVKSDKMTPPVQAEAQDAHIVEPVGDKLQYNTYSDKGDKLSDFSYAGFYAGKYEIPDSSKIKTVATVEPSEDPNADDTERIQKIIDDTYENAPNDYFKVIRLKAGRYNINEKGISLKTGIILAGEGQGPTGTVIYATAPKQYSVIKINGELPKRAGDKHLVNNDYIPMGSNTLTLSEEDIKNYKAGDLITLCHDSTYEWIDAIGMKGTINIYGQDTSWVPGTADTREERYIKEISGNTITVDMPFFIKYDKSLSQAYIYKTEDDKRIQHVGIENLRIESYFNGNPEDENHANIAIATSGAKNCYIRDVSTKYFVLSAVQCMQGSKQITVKNVSSLEPVSTFAGSRRYSFALAQGTQQILFTGCYSYCGRHDFEASGPAVGPSVFNDSVVDQAETQSETHGTWSTGILYDNVYSIGDTTLGTIGFVNRGKMGTPYSQGWTGAGVVAWNCLAGAIIGNKVPTNYENFIVGMWGMPQSKESKRLKADVIKGTMENYSTGSTTECTPEQYETDDNTTFVGDCYKESKYAPVNPRSLYKAQLAERITGSFKNVRPNAPVITAPRGEEENLIKSNDVKIEGFFEKGAEKVTVYVNNLPYDATLNQETYGFNLDITLEDGVHKLYATQTIGGVESTKCADRFIVVNKLSENVHYLQSNYEYDKVHQLINDNVISFDQYQAPFAELSPEVIRVKIGESMLKTDVDPIETNGRVLVPMRAIFETFEAEVGWDEATATATAVRGDIEIKVTENEKTVKVNGKDVELDVPATIVNGRFLVPVRFISETFGAEVGWNDPKRMVLINGGVPKYIADHGLENEINIYEITQSGDNGTGDSIFKAVDNNLNTTWTFSTLHENGAWGIFDLGFKRDIKDLYIAFAMGTVRIHSFDVLVSDDGINYTTAKENLSSSGQTLDLQCFPINAKGRYVKIIGKGNQIEGKENWNNYYEIVFTENK